MRAGCASEHMTTDCAIVMSSSSCVLQCMRGHLHLALVMRMNFKLALPVRKAVPWQICSRTRALLVHDLFTASGASQTAPFFLRSMVASCTTARNSSHAGLPIAQAHADGTQHIAAACKKRLACVVKRNLKAGITSIVM
eukprot:TRINITY_DN101648_c0_g1_i1.p1 TRINITY_DN101648_c0_g1~~TRINITY_DN101648_c0_g1_i1.p1  ORF type:complete len:139 (+),score=21.56 TRINITY_DN101648_c0_g1_i1:47-463(+)